MGLNRLSEEELWRGTESYLWNLRLRKTMDFIEDTRITFDKPWGTAVDCGEDNPARLIMQDRLGVRITSKDWDFNFPLPPEVLCYDDIFALEVLEHVFNPLTFLLSVKGMMGKNSFLYLTTPRVWPQYMRSMHHFHEIPTDRLMWLFEAAGLKVLAHGTIPLHREWWHHFIGIRPLIRWFWKSRIYVLKIK